MLLLVESLSSEYKRGGSKAYLVFGFIMFWLCLFVFHALMAIMLYGLESNLAMRFLSWEGYLPTKIYFLSSSFIAAVCLGIFLYYVARDFKARDETNLSRLVSEAIKNSEERLNSYIEEKFGQISMGQYTVSETVEAFSKSIRADFEKLRGDLGGLKSFMEGLEKQNFNLKELKKIAEEVKVKLTPKPFLTVSSGVDKVVGVGKKTAATLKSAGIESVQKLIMEEPETIAQKTGLSTSLIRRIYAAANMLMVPGINAKAVKTFQKIGVCSLEELAFQSPIELYTRIFRICGKEVLSLDEISYCVWAARRYASKNFEAFTANILAFPESFTQATR